jgi:putative FmdB family regulatory protein
MPLYDYRCQKCQQTFEVMQKFSDEPLKVHEDCGGELERLISPPALQFKGSGWYVTDYARGGSSTSSGASDSKSEKKSDTKAETKTESKPATTSTTDK